LTNNGSIHLTNELVFCYSNVVNNGSIALDAAVFEVFPLNPQHPSVSLTNAGTIQATHFGTIFVRGATTNRGTISGTMRAREVFGGGGITQPAL
jgi:hypothetical protein